MCTFSIDATYERTGKGRMVNDSAPDDPMMNSKMMIVEVNGEPHLCLFAIRKISVGEELRYDYGEKHLPWRKVLIEYLVLLS